MVSNGCNYENEETAAHASDTLARKLMENGEKALKLNFPDDYTEVHRGKVAAIKKFTKFHISIIWESKEKKKTKKC